MDSFYRLLLKTGAVAGIIGLFAITTGNLLYEIVTTGESSAGIGLMIGVGHILMIFGSLGLLALIGEDIGLMGKIGFILTVSANAALVTAGASLLLDAAGVVSVSLSEVGAIAPILIGMLLFGHIGYAAGFILIGFEGLRTQKLPRATGIMFITANILVGTDMGQFGHYVFIAGLMVSFICLIIFSVKMWKAASVTSSV